MDHRHDPYLGVPEADWLNLTHQLISEHPLSSEEIVETVLLAWRKILSTKIAGELEFGKDFKPNPQMMGNFLHKLIAVLFDERYPRVWREGVGNREKDLEYVPDDFFSTEIKTSSSRTIYANRSYAQPSAPGTKKKDGYYIAINFGRFADTDTPEITRVAFGWLDHRDWVPQASATGQQASLTRAAKLYKLIDLYTNN